MLYLSKNVKNQKVFWLVHMMQNVVISLGGKIGLRKKGIEVWGIMNLSYNLIKYTHLHQSKWKEE